MQCKLVYMDANCLVHMPALVLVFKNPYSCRFADLSRWQKLIQKPYENGDDRGLKLVRAILRPLMLRRTKETKDKIGKYVFLFQSHCINKYI